MTAAVSAQVSALQAALAAEDAAIFGYGVAGAHLTGTSQAAAERDWTGHHEARDALAAMISRLGAQPAAAQAFYQLPFRVHDAASARALAARLEDGVTRAYLGLVAVTDQGLRRFGAMAMQGAAQRAAFWRGSTEAFPGLELLSGPPRRIPGAPLFPRAPGATPRHAAESAQRHRCHIAAAGTQCQELKGGGGLGWCRRAWG